MDSNVSWWILMYPNESNWLPKRLLQVPSFCFVSGYVHKMLLEQQPFLCKGADIFSRLALKDWGKHTYALLTQESLVHGLTQHGHMRTGVCLSEHSITCSRTFSNQTNCYLYVSIYISSWNLWKSIAYYSINFRFVVSKL